MTARVIPIALGLAFLLAGTAHAEKFRLKSGDIIEGTIRHEDAEYFTVQLADESDLIVFKSDVAERGASVRGAPTVTRPPEPPAPSAPKPAAAPAPDVSESPGRDWFEGVSGYDRALRKQKETGEPMAIYFYATWCPYCKAFDKNVLNTRDVKRQLESALKVRVDIDKNAALAQKFGVQAVPAFIVVSGKTGFAQKFELYNLPEPFIEQCRSVGLGSRS